MVISRYIFAFVMYIFFLVPDSVKAASQGYLLLNIGALGNSLLNEGSLDLVNRDGHRIELRRISQLPEAVSRESFELPYFGSGSIGQLSETYYQQTQHNNLFFRFNLPDPLYASDVEGPYPTHYQIQFRPSSGNSGCFGFGCQASEPSRSSFYLATISGYDAFWNSQSWTGFTAASTNLLIPSVPLSHETVSYREQYTMNPLYLSLIVPRHDRVPLVASSRFRQRIRSYCGKVNTALCAFWSFNPKPH